MRVDELIIRFDLPRESFSHAIGNIADDIWRQFILHHRYEIKNGFYYAFMENYPRKPIRKKQLDEIKKRVKKLNKDQPDLNAKIIYTKDKS